MRQTSLTKDPKRMVITTLQCCERQNCGETISNAKSIQWTLQSAWLWSNSHASWRLETSTIIFWTQSPILPYPENLQSRIGTIWMLSRAKRGVWCCYCKTRYGTNTPRGQTPAVWTITSKRGAKLIVRSYCHPCAMEAQTWHDGTVWTFKEQIEYAKGDQLDVQFE